MASSNIDSESTGEGVLSLAVAVSAAIQAGDYFRSRLDTELQVKTKSSPADLVTDVDPHCEKIIRECIQASFPHHQVLGEESVDAGSEASTKATSEVMDADDLWIVDPLDGTTNFVFGMPLSTVSIAYAKRGCLMSGVVYDPYRGEVFLAQAGHGAWRVERDVAKQWVDLQMGSVTTEEGRSGKSAEVHSLHGEHSGSKGAGLGNQEGWSRLSVSLEKRLEGSIVATGFPPRVAAREQTIAVQLRIAGRAKNLRALGSAALHLAYVASGRIDVFWEHDLNAWDLAAGVLLIQEAGGTVKELGGGNYHLAVRDILVSGQPEVIQAIESVMNSPQ